MADPWLLLLAGAALVIVGFLAAQLFDRHRIPDYFVLLALGLGLGLIPGLGDDARASLAFVAPVLTEIAIAFILFEGGMALRARLGRSDMSGVVGHTAIAMAISGIGVWFVATRGFGLNDLTALILAAAFIGPSAAIILSILPVLRVTERTRVVLTFEGVLGNVLAVAFVLLFVQFPGTTPGAAELVTYLMLVGASAAAGVISGVLWHRLVSTGQPPRFSFMTSVAIALFLYALGEGVLGGTGGVAAFSFGIVLGYRGTLTADFAMVPRGAPGARGLPEFHQELVFLLRTFFFLYLGLRLDVTGMTPEAVLAALALVGVFLVSRVPSTAILGRGWRLPRLDARVLRATVARGMTDTVLVLYAIDVGVVDPARSNFVTQLLFLVVLFAATVSAFLVARAERLEMKARRSIPPVAVEAVAAPPSTPAGNPAPARERGRDPIDDLPPR